MPRSGWYLAVIVLVLLSVGCRSGSSGGPARVQTLKYAFCTDPCQADSDWVTVVADSAQNVGQYVSLAIGTDTDNRPAMAYYDAKNQDLIYEGCLGNCRTTTPLWSFARVDAASDVGRHASLGLTKATLPLPRIVYYDATNQKLKFLRFDLGAWQFPVTVDTGGVGEYASMALKDGQPRIAYYDRTNSALQYAFCLQDCSSASDIVTTPVDPTVTIPGNLERAISLALNKDGNPGIAYYNVASGKHLKYAFCTANCASATPAPVWLISTVDGGADDTGQYSSLAFSDTVPSISYYDATRGTLWYVTCLGDCLTAPKWSLPAEVATGGREIFSSLRVDTTSSKIAFYDATSETLRYAFCAPTIRKSCTDPTAWTIVKVDGPSAGKFASLATDSTSTSRPSISYVAEAAP